MGWTNEGQKSRRVKKIRKNFHFQFWPIFLMNKSDEMSKSLTPYTYGTSRLKAKQDNDFDLQD